MPSPDDHAHPDSSRPASHPAAVAEAAELAEGTGPAGATGLVGLPGPVPVPDGSASAMDGEEAAASASGPRDAGPSGPSVPPTLLAATRELGEHMSSGGDPAAVIDAMLHVLRTACGADVAAVNRIRDRTLTILHADVRPNVPCDPESAGEPDLVGLAYPLPRTICRIPWSCAHAVVLDAGDPAFFGQDGRGLEEGNGDGEEERELGADPLATPPPSDGFAAGDESAATAEDGQPADPPLAGYAGRTLIIDGRRWGTVAVWSRHPLAVGRDEAALLVEMAASAVVAQIARSRTRLLFRELEATAGIGAWSYSLTSGVLWWSDEVFRIHGLDPDQFTPTVEHAVDFYHPDDRTTIRLLVEHCILAGEPWDVRLRIVTSAGEMRWVRARGQRVHDAGVPARVVGTFEDVHEQVLAELERETMRSRLEHAIHGTDDGLWDWPDMDRDEQWWSPRFLQLVGRTPGEIPPRHSSFLELVHPDDRQAVADEMTSSRERGEPFEMEFRLLPKDGAPRWFLGRARVTTGRRARAPRMAGSIQDVDERRRMESLLRDRTREIETFLHAASHDLKSPLLTIDAFSEQIQHKAAEGSRAELVHAAGRVRAAAGRMQAIVRDLLAYGRTGRTEPVRRPVELAPLVAELRHQLAGAFDRRSVRIETDFRVPAVLADRGQMTSLLQNLLTNAIEHGLDEEGRGRIVIGSEAIETQDAAASPERGVVRVFVQDLGAGIAVEDRERIFLPFERRRTNGATPAGDYLGGGTGLGLAIVRQVAEAWDGRAWVTDGIGGGARFIVEWPGSIAEDECQPPASSSLPEP